MTHRQDEDHLYGTVSAALKRWLSKAKEAVMKPWNQFKTNPDPTGVYMVQQDWDSEVDTILTEIGKIALNAWSQATDVPPVSRHAFVMSQLAQTRNFLVRIPDEVYNLVFAAIIDVVNGGGNTQAVADAVDNVLSWTGSENWPNRARVIAMTETTRAYGAGTLAAGMEQSRVTGKLLRKKWVTEQDRRVRPSHEAVDNETIPLASVFMVGGYPMLYPGDPFGPADEVVNCRCDLVIVD